MTGKGIICIFVLLINNKTTNYMYLDKMHSKAIEYGIEGEFSKFLDNIQNAKFETIGGATRLTGLSYLMGIDSSSKILKGNKKDYYTGVLYLAPAKNSGVNLCPKATNGCEKACLFHSGRASIGLNEKGLSTIKKSRFLKTVLYFVNRSFFMDWLDADIGRLKSKAIRDNKNWAIRLNGTSDILISQFKNSDGDLLVNKHSDTQFYDYTKIVKQLTLSKHFNNYHITFSYGGSENLADTVWAIENGFNVSVVFDELPDMYMGKKVINADQTDLRFLDEKNVVCGLTVKTPVRKGEFLSENLDNDFIVRVKEKSIKKVA